MWLIIILAIILFVIISSINKKNKRNNQTIKTEHQKENNTIEELESCEPDHIIHAMGEAPLYHPNSVLDPVIDGMSLDDRLVAWDGDSNDPMLAAWAIIRGYKIETNHQNEKEIKEHIENLQEKMLKRNPESVKRHFELIQMIKEVYGKGDYDQCIKLCLEDIAQFKQFENDYFCATNEDCKLLQMCSFETLCKIYEKQERYIEAIKICDLAIEYNLIDGTQGGFLGRKERIEKKISKSLQVVSKTPKQELQKTETQLQAVKKDSIVKIDNSHWHISVSFGKSSSDNYMKAVYLAKQSNNYLEDTLDGKILHQATFGEDPKSYLNFIALYELVSSWKSSFVIINGEVVDRKIVQGLNYCYGDKCRSGKSDFCFGASEMTNNPFGCHRLQISQYNHPWWSFGYWENDSFIVDKTQIKKRAQEYGYSYQYCPSYNADEIMRIIEQLPSILIKKNHEKLSESTNQFLNPR